MARLPVPAPALPADLVAFRAALLAWFDRDGRALEFRVEHHPDPWAVLVSEVMAQQTQVARVNEKWRAFIDRFPDPESLASAPTGDVIRAWRGLGYNRRAIDLQRAARAILAAGGGVPDDIDALRALPGVGPYTARAVAAIAFGRPVGAVDVNVRRVIGRLTTAEQPRVPPSAAVPAASLRAAANPASVPSAQVQAIADALVDPARPGPWTHALMDLGAATCRPARPACHGCPVRAWCGFAGSNASLAASAVTSPTSSAVTSPAERAALRRATELAPAGPAVLAPKARPRTSTSTRPSRDTVPFEATTRWLRGRIVDRLCSVPPGTSVTFEGPVGLHLPAAVAAALASLEADGLVELDGIGAARLAGERA